MEIEGKSSLKKAQKWFKEFEPHLREACIGQISEIFDATEPHYPKGCIAQAWGVAEVLRAYKKYLTLLKQD
jgi:glycogen debranching enzyme